MLFVHFYIWLIWTFEASVTSTTPSPRPLSHGIGRGTVVHADVIKKVIGSSGPKAEIYSWSLYGCRLGLPVWDPTPVAIGSFGYFLDGRFEPFGVNMLDGGDNPFFYHASSVESSPSIKSRPCPQSRWILCPSMARPSGLTPHQKG
jgi:hypothetical protein